MPSQESGGHHQQAAQNDYDRTEEYLRAQRAAVEAVHIGRETLDAAVRQGEQLDRAEFLAEETEYKLDRATRMLRGMTWPGWWANKFSHDIAPPEFPTEKQQQKRDEISSILPPLVYEKVPPHCIAAAQAIQNYQANLQVLEACETLEQRETCQMICDEMYQQAKRYVTALHRLPSQPPVGVDPGSNSDSSFDLPDVRQDTKESREFPSRLGKDLQTLRQRQQGAEGVGPRSPMASKTAPTPQNRDEKQSLFSGKAPATSTTAIATGPTGDVQRQQEDHLDTMSKHLEELGSLATHLNTSLAQHSNTLESLDEKNDSMLFKSKMVTRRTDRLIQKKSWTRPKSEFLYTVSIRHLPTGHYLAVSPANSTTLVLSPKFNETCLFGLSKRKSIGSQIFGLQSNYSRRWVGQNLFGQLACSAYYFDKREEWDIDNESDWTRTSLLCASAGWGNGGYLLVQPASNTHNPPVLTIGGGGLEDKKKADLWCVRSEGSEAS